jgi:hypothetical protein
MFPRACPEAAGDFLVSSGNIPMLKGKTATGGPGVRKVAKKRRKKIKVIF